MAEMPPAASPGIVRNVSDTARWAAYFRAEETKRPDAIFRDPFAQRLCGQHGVDIANTLPDGNKHAWAWVTRTYLFDHFITHELQQGTDLVLNLSAGLDARPFRMNLPASLQWIEIDLPEILAYNEGILALASPGLLKMMQKTMGKHLSQVGAPFKFAPAQGPEFFTPHGWNAMEVKPVLQTAAQFKRPPLLLRLLARLPQKKGPAGNRP